MNHFNYIRYCLQLAAKGHGYIGNGALVGSCLVRDEGIIAEGYHAKFGEFHAERNALNVILSSSKYDVQPDDFLYVNLEPCCHHGKTPPCTDIIIESGVKTVVFGMYDPDPRVAGQGITILQNAGIQVIGPICPEVCRRLNKGYVSVREQNRPYITLKRAQMPDGSIANEDGSPLKITSTEQDEWSHSKLRVTHNAILVGVGTVIADDPRLTIRTCHPESVEGSNSIPNPIRIVLDPNLRIPLESKIVSEEMAAVTIVIHNSKPARPAGGFIIHNSKISTLQERGVRLLDVQSDHNGFDLHALFQKLITPKDDYIGITSILVEGGQKTWDMFKQAGMYDEEVVLVGALENKA